MATLTNVSRGRVTYTPNLNANGQDMFTFKVSDGALDSAVAVVIVNITPVNDAPVAADMSVETTTGSPVSGVLQATDADGDLLSFAGAKGKKSRGMAVISPSGAFTYTPPEGFTGVDSFTYTVSDGVASISGKVTVVVSP